LTTGALTLGARLRTDAVGLAASTQVGFDEAVRALARLAQVRLGLSSAQRIAREAEPFPAHLLVQYAADVERLVAGEPIAYVLGEQPFRDRVFRVTSHVLIPRADTELLVACVLDAVSTERTARILDLGTGSGCIAISIALARPACEVVAVDASAAALAVARENAERLGAGNVRLLVSDWCSALEGERFDIIVSNPPYIATGDPHLADLRHEPRRALVSGADGLDDIRRIVAGAREYLGSSGVLMVEHGHDQRHAVMGIFRAGGFGNLAGHDDLAGRPRVVAGQYT
jgi:release factor glutamine methyltransferase